jgi:bacterioferritin (cytochrome b1)
MHSAERGNAVLMASSEETLDEKLARERLNAALSLQYRSALGYTLASASLFGFEYQALGDRLWEYGQAELADARLLVEKIVALEGEPTTEVAPLSWTGDPADAVTWLIETETEAIEALKAGIEPTGREGRSEALEHTLEHLIMRKQNQIDFLLRARRIS